MHIGHRLSVRWTGAAMVTAGILVFGGAIVTTPSSVAASNAHGNAGDVWVDNVGQPPGPGHEMDPHLACGDINVWGNGLAPSSGTYTVDGWPPSGTGKKDQAWPGTAKSPSTQSWSYSGPGSTVVSVIDVDTLLAHAMANGDTAQAQQGFHFKLQFTADPQKHKTFWVRCAAPTPTPTEKPTPTPTATPTPTPTPTPTATPVATTTSSVAAASTAVAPSAVKVSTPSTGADAPFGLGMLLALGGLTTLGASYLRRRKAS